MGGDHVCSFKDNLEAFHFDLFLVAAFANIPETPMIPKLEMTICVIHCNCTGLSGRDNFQLDDTTLAKNPSLELIGPHMTL
jgi:hypothetical protein